MKRILAILLAILMVVIAVVPVSAVNTPWYNEAVEYVTERNLMIGDENGNFNPDGVVTRAQMAQTIYALANIALHNNAALYVENYYLFSGGENYGVSLEEGDFESKSSYASGFRDVFAYKWTAGIGWEKVWYHEAVSWCHLTGILSGYPNKYFGPNDPVTREQFVCALYNLQDWLQKNAGDKYLYHLDLNPALLYDSAYNYYDFADVSPYATTAAGFAWNYKIIAGTSVIDEKIVYSPKNTITRAQLAQLLKTYCTAAGI